LSAAKKNHRILRSSKTPLSQHTEARTGHELYRIRTRHTQWPMRRSLRQIRNSKYEARNKFKIRIFQ
jgi:hypothetical protein